MPLVIRAISFKCIDESGADWSGSDEPYWVFTAIQENGTSKTTKSRVFGGVDSGDTKRFRSGAPGAGENIVWPAQGQTGGAPGNAILSIQLFESDQGDPESIRKSIDTAFKASIAAAAVPGLQWLSFASQCPEIVKGAMASFVGDDLMGSTTVTVSEKRLLREFPRGGSRMEKPYRLGGSSGDLPFEVAGGPDYDINLEIEVSP